MRPLWQRSHCLCIQAKNGVHFVDTLGAITNLALYRYYMGDAAGAPALQEKAIKLKQAHRRPGHPFIGNAMANLAR